MSIGLLLKKLKASSLLKASGVYVLGSILKNAITFLLLPVLTRYLTPYEYGLVAMFTLMLSIVNAFSGLSVHGAIQRVYYDDSFVFKEYVANCLFILVGSVLVVLVVVVLLKGFISSLTGIPQNWLSLIVVMSFFQFAILSLLSIYQARMEAFKYMVFQVGQTSLNVGLSVFLVVFLLLHWQGRVLGKAISLIVFGIIALYILSVKWSEFRLNIDYIKHALRFGIPLIPHTLGGMLMMIADRIIVKELLGLGELGVYSVGIQLCMGILILHSSVNRALNPWIFGKLAENKYLTKLELVKFTYIYFILLLVLGVAYAFLIRGVLGIIVDQRYSSVASLVFYFSVGASFSGMYNMVAKYIFYAYKTSALALVTLVVGGINIVLNYVMISLYNLEGAAITYLLINIIMFLLTWIISARVFEMPWLLGKMHK